MKNTVCLVLVILMLLCASTIPGYAAEGGGSHGGGGYHGGGTSHGGGGYYGGRGYYGRGRFGADIWIGPGWGWWDPWWGAPYYPYYYPYYPETPAYQQQPQTYIQPVPQQEEQPYYWYFCRKPEGYYPYVKRCPGGWLKVVPPSGPPNEEE